MSNRFKFRAWLPSWQEMNYSHAPGDVDWFFNGEHFILSVFYDDGFAGQMQELEGVVIMQSTGLKDKNGVEIFEGDILFHKLQGKCVVYYPFNESTASFGLKRVVNGFKNTLQDADRLYEVIGNIHENPELLENKQ